MSLKSSQINQNASEQADNYSLNNIKIKEELRYFKKIFGIEEDYQELNDKNRLPLS